jgi:hypothetical protein
MIPAVGINDRDYIPKLQEFLRIALRYDPLNIGTQKGNMFSHTREEVIAMSRGIVHAVWDNPETVTQFLKELKKADMGLSVVVSGIFDSVDECCKKAGLKRHTVNFSLGIWGKTEKLPPDDILEVTTMCGHGLVSAKLVKSMVEEIKTGKKTPEDAAKVLTPLCPCGIFNPLRATKLLAAMARK